MKQKLILGIFALIVVCVSSPFALGAASRPYRVCVYGFGGCFSSISIPATDEDKEYLFFGNGDLEYPVYAKILVFGPIQVRADPTVSYDYFGNVQLLPDGTIPIGVGKSPDQCQLMYNNYFLPFAFIFTSGTYSVGVKVVSCSYGTTLAQNTINVTPTPAPPNSNFQLYTVAVQDKDGNTLSTTVAQVDLSQPHPAFIVPQQQVKLGEVFSVTVSDTTTAIPTTSDESLSNVAEAAHSLSSNIFSSVTELFQGKVVVHSPASSNSIHHLFFPIHSGTANVHFSVEGADLVVPMQVTNCGAGDCTPQLGTSRPDFDDLLMQYADRNGIPPQLLKAQIQQESGFNPNAYRYEPLSVDFAQITAPNRGGIAFGALRQAALAPWALATSNNCSTILQPQGANLDLASDDATARQKYSLSLAPNGTTTLCRLANAFQTRPTRPINASDTLPSMENVFYTNDNNASPNNWEIIATKAGSKTPQRFYDYQVDFPPFTAQTVIAASYGLHQLLYPTAVREGYKAQNGIGLSPGNLFDPATSLDLGTEYLAQQFKISRTQELTDYQDVTEDTFQFQFAPALARYNGNRITVPDAQNNCSQALIAPPVGQKNPLAAYVYTCRIINNAPIFDPVPLPPANNGGGGGGTPQN